MLDIRYSLLDTCYSILEYPISNIYLISNLEFSIL
jgi:hypothetical protein